MFNIGDTVKVVRPCKIDGYFYVDEGTVSIVKEIALGDNQDILLSSGVWISSSSLDLVKSTKTIKFKGVQPEYMTKGAAGADLITVHDYFIEPNQVVLVDSGTAVQIPDGYVGLLCARSSIAFKRGLRLVNGVGVIDSDFQDTIKFAYQNVTDQMVKLSVGERVGQILFMECPQFEFEKVEKFTDETVRGAGFGDTGK
jgi:dUTP pyrophosphatase